MQILILTLCLVVLQLIRSEIKRNGRRYKKFYRTLGKMCCRAVVWSAICILLILFGHQCIKNETEYMTETEKWLYDNVHCVEEKIFANNQHILSQLTKEKYAEMTNDERVNILYQLAQLESIYLTGKKSKTLHFRYEDIVSDKVAGYYDFTTNTIVADIDIMPDYEFMIRLVAHESYHRYEKYLIDGGTAIGEKVARSKIQIYSQELSNYIDLETNRNAYHDQICEKDAYSYSYKTMRLYVDYIEKHFG